MAAADPSQKSVSVLRRRWRKFRTLKRGWYSLIAICVMYVLSLLAPLYMTNRAWIVKYEGTTTSPCSAAGMKPRSSDRSASGRRITAF
ncbi:MAG: hypothetical protein R3E96_06520 [Planctomycetota bacterium]